MPQYGPFSAWVEIDGVPAREFQIQAHIAHKVVLCSIPSEIGKTFSVVWRNSGWDYPTAGHIFVDGQENGGRVLKGPSGLCARYEGLTDCTTLRRFTFDTLKITDDALHRDHAAPPLPSDRLGIIELAIYPIQIIDLGYDATISHDMDQHPGLPEIEIDERLYGKNMSVTQQIKLGEPKYLAAYQPVVSHHFLGPPLVTFAFKYRPLEILQATGVAPPPVPAIPFTLRPQLKRKLSSEADSSVFAPSEYDADEEFEEESNLDGEELRVLRDQMNALELRRKIGKRARIASSNSCSHFDVHHIKEEFENVPPATAWHARSGTV